MHGVDGSEDAGRGDEVRQAEKPENQEPHEHEGAEDARRSSRCPCAEREQDDEDRERDRDHVMPELRGVDRQALDGAEHRDRRRDRPVGVEQGRPDEPEHDEVDAPSAGRDAPDAEQREHGDDAALAPVVGLEDEDAVLDRDDDDQRPRIIDRRPSTPPTRPRHGRPPRRPPPSGVKRARADVAEDDAKRDEARP